ncbi:sulfatase-like hydrolase/transferase [Hoeflea sp. WL0058]|uniref:Sulfatase-like hydrolase/transferase n=1 Tax=Flavimaribacter sediminis TaxID=2865987 RepID=A0AAE2ZS59_9HYPH|nr:sulfatase-like hydrolase/transferase [Flavimaribacter sediminis]MBW8639897.1 sulfatase-like hydrolase/transferase [Flavimaribacter sediminis]
MAANIIVFLTDDHGQWALGSSGNPGVETPNLDYLARTGAVMENAFTPTPVCSPARACFLTGCTASQHGVHDYLDNEPARFGRDWLEGQKTAPELLQSAGYETGLVGKWHLGNDTKPARGFEHWGALAGDYPIDAAGPARYCKDGEVVTIAGSKADVITDAAIDFLRKRDGERPFFLVVGHVSTHSPWEGHPERLADRYRSHDFAELPQGESFPFGAQNLESRDLIDRAHQSEALAQYYASVTAIDEGVGRVLDALDAAGVSENTLIVYTSDHGLNCSHHGIWGKGNGTLPLNMVEETIRIPLIVSGPGVEKEQRRAEFVDHLDLFQTVLDVAGVNPPTDIDYAGRSYLGLLGGGDLADWRDLQFCEYGTTRMARGDRYKCVEWLDTGTVRLFDLVTDPREETDIAGDNPELCRSFLDLIAAYYDRFSTPEHSGARPGGPEPTNETSPWVL